MTTSLKALLERVRSSCLEGQRGLRFQSGDLTSDDHDDIAAGGRVWQPDCDGFESIIDDLDTALSLLPEPSTGTPTEPMNEWQAVVARSYDGGEFSYLVDDPDWQQQLSLLGDTLFQFLLLELGDGEGCDSLDTATLRLGTALHQIAECLAALSQMSEGGPHHG